MANEILRQVIHDHWAEWAAANPELARNPQSYPDIAAAGNAPTEQPNEHAGETTTITVHVAPTLAGIMGVATDEEGAAMYMKMPSLMVDLRDAIDNYARSIAQYEAVQNVATATAVATYNAYLNKLLNIVAAGQVISQQTKTAIKAQLDATRTITKTEPATVAGPPIFEAAGLGYVTPADIQGVDNDLQLGGAW